MSGAPVTVVGGSVAALVAADALARRGVPVDLFLPERGVGGGFLPFERDGRRLDLGPRVLELSYDGEPRPSPPLADYRPGPHGHRPYLELIDQLVAGIVGDDLSPVGPAEVSVGGRRTSDYVLAGDLTRIADAVDASLLATMAAEAAARVEVEGPHGAFAEGRGGLPWDRSFAAVGEDYTGATFHRHLIEPIAAKILPGGASRVLAPLHRKIWLPLFHPATAWAACTGAPDQYRPDRPFATVAGGGMGEVVRRLVERVTGAPGVTVHREGPLTGLTAARSTPDAVDLAFAGGGRTVVLRPIVGVGAGELFAAVGASYEVDQVVATMVWVDLPEAVVRSLPSVLFSAEPEVEVMRVTENLAEARPGVRTVCCEIADGVAKDRWEQVALDSLRTLGVASTVAGATVVAAASRPAFAVPGAASAAEFSGARAALDALGLPIEVVGGATAFAVDSFNEQVVQGLAAAERR